MERIGQRLSALSGTWHHVTWQKAPPKGDAADYLAQGGTVAGIEAMVDRPRETLHIRLTASATPEPSVRRWPKPLDTAAYYGVLGRIARELQPYIEADSAALLINLVTSA